MKLKKGVKIEKLTTQMMLGILMVQEAYEQYSYDCIITSITDGKHSTNSKHYDGNGVDFRTRHVPKSVMKIIVKNLKHAMDELYDIVLESDHLHVEYDPK